MLDVLLSLIIKLLVGFLFILGVIVILSIPLWIIYSIRFKRLAKKRAGLSICQFARSFDYRRIDTKIIRAAYEGLQSWTGFGVKNFPVMATDNITDIYGMADEDLDDFAEELAQKTGRNWNNLENNPLYGKVHTVEELVLFVNQQPRVTA